jgi:hypothetical protein
MSLRRAICYNKSSAQGETAKLRTPAWLAVGLWAPVGLSIQCVHGEELQLPFKGSASSSSPAVDVMNAGDGPAAKFSTGDSPTNRSPAVEVDSTGVAPAIRAANQGAGQAISGVATGTGSAAALQVDNQNNAAPGLRVSTNGTGPAAAFLLDNSNSSSPALKIDNTGNGVGIAVSSRNGLAAEFHGNTSIDGDLKVSNGTIGVQSGGVTIVSGGLLVINGEANFLLAGTPLASELSTTRVVSFYKRDVFNITGPIAFGQVTRTTFSLPLPDSFTKIADLAGDMHVFIESYSPIRMWASPQPNSRSVQLTIRYQTPNICAPPNGSTLADDPDEFCVCTGPTFGFGPFFSVGTLATHCEMRIPREIAYSYRIVAPRLGTK